MTDAVTRRWQAADAAVESLTATLVAAVAQTADRGVRKRPRGRRRAQRRPKGTRRRVAEVIRSRRLAPGMCVDRNMVAALLLGHRDLVSNPVLVVAVARACGIITGRKLSAKKAARMRAASIRVGALIARAEAHTPVAPTPQAEPVPVLVEPAPVLVEPAPVSVEPAPVPAEPAPVLVDAVPARALVEAAPALVEAAPVFVEAAPPPSEEPALPDAAPVAVGRRRRRRGRRRAWPRWLAAAGIVLIVVAILALACNPA